MLSGQWHKTDPQDILRFDTVVRLFLQHQQFLITIGITDRNHQPPADSQLIDQRFGDMGNGSGKENRFLIMI